MALKEGAIARFDGVRFQHFELNEAEKQQFGGGNVLNLHIGKGDSFQLYIQNKPASFDPLTGRYQLLHQAEATKQFPNDFTALHPNRSWERRWQLLENPRRMVRKGSEETFILNDATLIYDVLETGSEIWVAAFEGLYKITPRKRLFETPFSQDFDLQNGPVTGMSVYGMAEWGGWLWFVGDKKLLRTPLNNPGKAETILEAGTIGGTYQMMADRQGWLWIGRFSKEIAFVNAKATPPIRPNVPSEVRSIHLPVGFDLPETRCFVEMPVGKIWAGCANGILEIDPAANTATPIQRDSITSAWHLFLAKNGDVWAGTENGLFRLSPKNGNYRISRRFHKGNTTGFASNKIISISEAGDCLWLGSDAGLVQLPLRNGQPSTARTFTVADGLPNNKVYFAIPGGDYLWCGTDFGLARISLAAILDGNGQPEIRTFHVDDGLPHEEFNTLAYFKSPTTGKIYLGGLNGMTVFSPTDLEIKAPPSPPFVFTEFEKYDQQHDTTLFFSLVKPAAQPVVLNHFDRFFTVRFALLSYANPAQNRYQYRLEGFEKNWNPVSHDNHARYPALPPGNYTLLVRAADHNGNWSSTELALPILVRQAWYKSWWAWAMYLLAAVGIGLGIYRQRMKRVQLEAKLKLEHAHAAHLEEMDRFKSRFFTNITHEFRTPLTVILGMTERLTATGGRLTEDESKNKLGLIKRSGENLLRLINQLLDLAKLEDKSLKMNYVQGDVLPYLRYVAESLHSLANAQNVMLRVESNEPKIVMDYDPERLLQIIHNLLSNAIKFTPSGGRVTLLVGMRDEELGMNQHSPSSLIPHPSSLVLAVIDTGIGIPAEDLPKIFDRFYQANNLEQAKAGGTGIGLALTKELVKAMHGEISVESEMGKGTKFTVSLPIVQPVIAKTTERYLDNPSKAAEFQGDIGTGLPRVGSPLREAEGRSHKGTPSIPQSFNPSILLIEDNADVVEYLADCLGRGDDRNERPYKLDFAYNGRSGIEKALETVPDLIISDVMMPEKDGFEVCDFLKNDERTSHIPIILLTAKADVESRITGLKRGADAYLAKPFRQEELLVTVQNLLEVRRKLQLKYRASALQLAGAGQPVAVPDLEDEFLLKIRQYVEENLSDANLSAEVICRKAGMSHTNLNLKMNALTGLPISLYVRALRLNRAKDLLVATQKTVAEIAYEVGFNDPKYFSRAFSEEFGKAPGEWRKNN